MSTGYGGRHSGDLWHPNMDVYETGEAVVVALEVPGVRPGDLTVIQQGDRLLVRGVRHPGKCENALRFHQIEIVCGPFEKEIVLPKGLSGGSVEASLALGILSLRIRKRGAADNAPEHKIDIEAR